MDAVAEHHIPLPPPSSSMSPAKQDRILIWRREVATASLEPAESANDASSSSATSTAASSSSSSSSSRRGRGRQALARIARLLSGRGSGSGRRRPSGARRHTDDDEAGVTRTAMYATLSPDYRPPAGEDAAGEVAPLRPTAAVAADGA